MLYSQIGSVRGTLYVSVPCKDGLVICADKRASQENTFIDEILVDDGITKIHRIDRTVACASIGNCFLIKNVFDDETKIIRTSEVLFDADAVIRKFYSSNNPIHIEENYKLLSKRLKDSYDQAIGRMNDENLRYDFEPSRSGYYHFQTLFFAADRTRGIRIYELTATCEGSETPTLNFSFRQAKANPFSIRPSVYAFFYVAKEIEKGSDPSFDKHRRESMTKRLLMNFEDPATVSVDDGMLFAREIFSVTYKRYRDVASPLTQKQLRIPPISKTMDCAVISFDRGFQWLERSVLVGED